jgi:RNA polymerase sigma-70 factor (ECF subfamily)
MEAIESPGDAELFSRIASGDAEAFAGFYDRHSRLLFGIAFKILGSAHEAEDILQDACVTFWERAPLYDSRLGTPLSWVVTLTRNKAIDRLRLHRRKADLVESAAAEAVVHQDPPTPHNSTQAVASGENAALVRAALDTLSADQREALHLGFFCGLTHAEIAERLNQPLGTIKARIRRGMLTLRDALEGRL